jgi:phage terminase large subunit GpA-like protein
MGSQMSKTEGILNVIAHRLDDGPRTPTLYIGPTQKNVQSLAEDRVEALLRSTPSLEAGWEKGQRNKRVEKWINGTRWGFAWAGSATELASHPAGLVMVDELDRMEADTGGEGDPVELARARTKNYPGAKLGIFSTPTIRGGSAIWSLWEEGTMGMWAWQCPACHGWIVPRRELLVFPEDAEPAEVRERARVVCEHCGVLLESDHRRTLNAGGRYLPHVRDANGDPQRVDIAPPNATASFWVSGLCSPWVTFGQVAETLVRAQRSGSDERVQGVVNTWLGELWSPAGDSPAWQEVLELRQEYEPGTVPFGVQEITAGVDVQARGLYFVIRGWGFNGESWLLRHGFIGGDTELDSVWLLLARALEPQLGEHRQRPRLVLIDSGYRPGDRFRRPIHQVYTWCRRHAGWWAPSKGHDVWQSTITPRVLQHAGGITLWHVNTDECKGWLYGRMQWPEDQPGGFHLHRRTDEEYARQLTAEEAVIRSNGSRLWRRVRRDNHYLDCEVLARAAAVVLRCDELPELGKAAKPADVAREAVERDWIPDVPAW